MADFGFTGVPFSPPAGDALSFDFGPGPPPGLNLTFVFNGVVYTPPYGLSISFVFGEGGPPPDNGDARQSNYMLLIAI